MDLTLTSFWNHYTTFPHCFFSGDFVILGAMIAAISLTIAAVAAATSLILIIGIFGFYLAVIAGRLFD